MTAPGDYGGREETWEQFQIRKKEGEARVASVGRGEAGIEELRALLRLRETELEEARTLVGRLYFAGNEAQVRHDARKALGRWCGDGGSGKAPPDVCANCKGTGVFETGSNDLPCELCPAGRTALFNVGGIRPQTGEEVFLGYRGGRTLPAAWTASKKEKP